MQGGSIPPLVSKFFIMILSIVLSITLSITPCKGVTKSGEPCKSTFVNKETGYCRIHDPNAHRCGEMTKAGKPCQMVTKEGACRNHQK
jgi:hypothetical protein